MNIRHIAVLVLLVLTTTLVQAIETLTPASAAALVAALRASGDTTATVTLRDGRTLPVIAGWENGNLVLRPKGGSDAFDSITIAVDDAGQVLSIAARGAGPSSVVLAIANGRVTKIRVLGDGAEPQTLIYDLAEADTVAVSKNATDDDPASATAVRTPTIPDEDVSDTGE